jgi:predicted ATPase/DNA-binding winged helix-turn-helix (wHTH) protein
LTRAQLGCTDLSNSFLQKATKLADQFVASPTRAISFGPFRLIPEQRLLLEGERPVRLGSRAIDILIALAERAGEQVSKRDLMTRIWPDTTVVEGNLAVHVAALRRALGDGQSGRRYIVNVPLRGYSFVAPVAVTDDRGSASPHIEAIIPPHNLPAHVTRLIGREEDVSKLVHQLPLHRLLTVAGAAGIGKTAVALAVAEELIPNYEHGVWLIDLAPVADPLLVPTALASTLRLEIRSDDPLPGLIAAVSDKRMLLVLDNCEHVIEAAAALAAGVLRGARGVQILATSREPLRLEGECVRRLSPLASPPPSVKLNAAEALGFPAVQLFVERAAATATEFELSDPNASTIGEICRRLDGLPLAIELAAARIDTFGVAGLAVRLDDRMRLLTGGRRAALLRHQTIGAALDWSYQLLSHEEQAIFRRLGIFAGSFTMQAADAVATDTETGSLDIADTVASLVAKSLITAEIGDGDARLRLLETMRTYAMTKLAQSGEADAIARRHASHYRDLLESTRTSSARDDSAAAFAHEIDNIRAALTWAFAPGGDGRIAVSLAAASAPIWLEMSLLTECHGWMGKALELLDDADRGTRREMVLQTALGLSLLFSQGVSSRARAALTRASEVAESLQDFDYQLRALIGLAMFCIRLEDIQALLALGRQCESIAKIVDDPVATCTADCIVAVAHASLGKHAEALTYARRVERRVTPVMRRAQIVRSGLDHSLQARHILAQSLWLQGLLDQAAQANHEVLVDAAAGGHPVSLCFALVWCGCVVSLGLGDIETAEGSIARLKDEAEKHGLTTYYACGVGFEGWLSGERGDLSTGERLLRASLEMLHRAQYGILYTPFLTRLAEIHAKAGRVGDSLAAIDEALQRAERNSAFWWTPEALRVKGEVLLALDGENRTAEEQFRRSLDLARRQGALSWELRSAMSLGQWRHAQGRTKAAQDLLNSVYAKFTEGFETRELLRAKQLLEKWS